MRNIKRYCQSSLLMAGIFLLLSFLPQITFANPGDPGGDPDLPIDGGVSLLIAAGVGYGIKKYRDERKKTLHKV